MPRLYDPDILKHSSPGEDLKWSLAGYGVLAAFAALIIGFIVLVASWLL